MTRTRLWALNVALAALVIAAAWLALNAGRIATPGPTALGMVDLPTERPPAPPAPFRRAPIDRSDDLGRRDVFAEAPAAVEPPPDDARSPAWRGVLPPVAAAPQRDFGGSRRRPDNRDPFGFADGLPEPGSEQFFGDHLVPPEVRESDRAGVVTAGEPGRAPIYAARPRLNPRREPEDDGTFQPSRPPPPTAESVLAGDAVEGFVLLGVFRSSGEDRALVRRPDGSSVRVGRGDEIEGWRVATIGDETIELTRASESRTLRLPD